MLVQFLAPLLDEGHRIFQAVKSLLVNADAMAEENESLKVGVPAAHGRS